VAEVKRIEDKIKALRFAQDVIASLQQVNPVPVNPHDVAMLSELIVDLVEIREEQSLS
jgi:hypothetical protein